MTEHSESGGWYPGERVGRLRASHSYGFVLALIVGSFLFTAFAPAETWAQAIIVLWQSVTLVVALWTSGLGRRVVLPSAALVVIGLVAALLELLGGRGTYSAVAGLIGAAMVLATIAVIAVGVSDQGSVNAQSILGAVCIYLMLGLLFTLAYGSAAELGDGPFFAQGTDGTPSIRMYFSYVTLATLGYGDYTAASTLGHTMSITEALLGQLYLVTVVAVLVSRLSIRSEGRT